MERIDYRNLAPAAVTAMREVQRYTYQPPSVATVQEHEAKLTRTGA